MDALKRGDIDVVFVPAGASYRPEVPDGMKMISVDAKHPGAGVYIYDQQQISGATIRDAAKAGTHGQLLGHLQSKAEIQQAQGSVVVQAKAKDGTPIQDSEVSKPELVQQQAEILQARHPGATIEVRPTDEVIAERAAANSATEPYNKDAGEKKGFEKGQRVVFTDRDGNERTGVIKHINELAVRLEGEHGAKYEIAPSRIKNAAPAAQRAAAIGAAPVHSIDITPEMKKSVVEEGQPLFKGDDLIRGRSEQAENAIVRNMSYSVHRPEGLAPYLLVNRSAMMVLNKAYNAAVGRGSFAGTSLDPEHANDIAAQLDTFAGVATDPDVRDALTNLAKTVREGGTIENGLTVVPAAPDGGPDPATLLEELIHSSIQRPVGIPADKLISHPVVQKMEPIIRAEYEAAGFTGLSDVQIVAEAFVDVVAGERDRFGLSPEEEQQFIADYKAATLEKSGTDIGPMVEKIVALAGERAAELAKITGVEVPHAADSFRRPATRVQPAQGGRGGEDVPGEPNDGSLSRPAQIAGEDGAALRDRGGLEEAGRNPRADEGPAAARLERIAELETEERQLRKERADAIVSRKLALSQRIEADRKAVVAELTRLRREASGKPPAKVLNFPSKAPVEPQAAAVASQEAPVDLASPSEENGERVEAIANSRGLRIVEKGEQPNLFGGEHEKMYLLMGKDAAGESASAMVRGATVERMAVEDGNKNVLRALRAADIELPAMRAQREQEAADAHQNEMQRVAEERVRQLAQNKLPQQQDLFKPLPPEAVTKLYDEDVKPAIEKAGVTMKGVGSLFIEAFFPRAEESSFAARALGVAAPRATVDAAMTMKGDRDQLLAQYDLATRAIEKMFDHMPQADRVAFIDRIMQGKQQPTAELRAISTELMKSLEGLRAQEKQWRALSDRENYFPLRWKVIPGSGGQARRGGTSGGAALQGNRSFAKEKTIPDASTGIKLGGRLETTNPVRLAAHAPRGRREVREREPPVGAAREARLAQADRREGADAGGLRRHPRLDRAGVLPGEVGRGHDPRWPLGRRGELRAPAEELPQPRSHPHGQVRRGRAAADVPEEREHRARARALTLPRGLRDGGGELQPDGAWGC
jgi:hypothetical protein